MYSLLRSLLFLLPTETSHDISLGSLRMLNRIGLLKAKAPKNQKAIEVFGLQFPGRVGLAAGLDKNADYIDALAALGFDFIEVGTVTPRPQVGNPLPRLFRLKQHQAIINRMGFNNKGVDYLVEQVKAATFDGILGINIGKNKDTPNEQALDDYLICMDKVYQHASYITINLSSPNTPGLRDLQFGQALMDLLVALKKRQAELNELHKQYVPLVVKISPDLDSENLEQIAEVLVASKVDGVIATNTTIDKTAVSAHKHGHEQGGLSGQPVQAKSTQLIRDLAQHLNGKLPIVGVGGINSAESGQQKIDAGADLVQVYTGFIYKGPNLIKDLAERLNY